MLVAPGKAHNLVANEIASAATTFFVSPDDIQEFQPISGLLDALEE